MCEVAVQLTYRLLYYFLLVTEGSGCDMNLGLEEETIQARSVLTNIETEMIFFKCHLHYRTLKSLHLYQVQIQSQAD